MQTISLKPVTAKAKNRIKEARSRLASWDGSTWCVLQSQDRVLFSQGSGPWLLVEPYADRNEKGDFSRWIHGSDDKDFTISSS